MHKLHIYLGTDNKNLREAVRMFGYVKEFPDGQKKRFIGRPTPLTLHRSTLMAFFMAVHNLEDNYEIHVYTNDGYVLQQIENGNLAKWETNGFRNRNGMVTDADLWKQLSVKLRYQKIVGHIGVHDYEERMKVWFEEARHRGKKHV